MSRRLDVLIEQRTRETNRLKAGQENDAVLESLHDSLAFLDQQIAKLEARIKAHIDQHPDLKEEFDLLKSVPGLGDKTASKLLAELPDVSRFDHVGQVVAYAATAHLWLIGSQKKQADQNRQTKPQNGHVLSGAIGHPTQSGRQSPGRTSCGAGQN